MKHNQNGAINMTLIVGIVAGLFVISLIFGLWAFSGRQKYKNNTDELINSAVATAKTQQMTTDDRAFAIEQEKPLLEWVGPEAYGTINLWYPRNWNVYIDQSGGSGYPVDGYFYSGILPSVTDGNGVNFPLRLQVENESYSQVLQQYQDEVLAKEATVTAYSLPKMPGVVGVEVVGTIEGGVRGTLVILPLRTEAVEVWTEGTGYLTQFNQYILANLSFSP